MKTIPTIISSFRESVVSLKEKKDTSVLRTDRDLSFKVVIIGSLILVTLMTILPGIPADGVLQKLLIGVLIIIFGFFFVTVASRIVGIVGSSNSPISGMTIATLMGTCLIFTAVGWSGQLYEPMALVVGGMICIAAAKRRGNFPGPQDRVHRRRNSQESTACPFYRRHRLLHCDRDCRESPDTPTQAKKLPRTLCTPSVATASQRLRRPSWQRLRAGSCRLTSIGSSLWSVSSSP